jgi:predicted lipid-binding transport protein (Tim44 family)
MRILTLLTLTLFTFSLMAFDAKARRMGGGKSFGKQRESLNLNRQQQAAPKPQPPGQSAAPAGAAGAAGAGAAAGGSKWLGPLAGLAAGGLLAALFMGGAFDGINMMDILLLIALAAAVFFIMRMLRKPASAQASRPMQYSGAGAGRGAGGMLSPDSEIPASSTRTANASYGHSADAQSSGLPADFDVDGFLMHAKRSFIALQAANDKRDLEELRAFTTPELFAELNKQIAEEGDIAQQTEVVFIEANLLDVTTEGNQAIASVRFTGQLRENPDTSAESFDEIWHVQKDLDESDSVWLLAGIQQVSDIQHS